MFDHDSERRFRRAIIEALALGECYALTLHDRLRARGIDRGRELPAVFRVLRALEAEGKVSSCDAKQDAAARLDRPRRTFKLTAKGIAERERLGVQ